MGTALEQKAITKRAKDKLLLTYNENKPYDTENTPMGGTGVGANFTHLVEPDLVSGGNDISVNGNPNIKFSVRVGNLSINSYTETKPYDYMNINTDENKGQVTFE